MKTRIVYAHQDTHLMTMETVCYVEPTLVLLLSEENVFVTALGDLFLMQSVERVLVRLDSD